ncbi:UDP-N-acetylglucosamine pyrophosphorylase [Ruminococcaceae bacterium OttesenSCG-928-D13]|nr:UDP-N-acetylglucosamine pyrophosphorylase [Ruminococcaceae bacterium OttesenSCG-928-D13]
MPVYTIAQLYDLSKTIAAPLLSGLTYHWEALAGLSDFILELGAGLPADRFDHPAEGVWIAKSATVAPSAFVGGPCIIDEEAEVRHCAFIRGSAIVGKGAVVGNSTELKNALLFDGVQVPHFNYVGDSVLGYKAHLGAGVITTNVKSDKSLVTVKAADEAIDTGRKKVGLAAGDFVEVGCNSALSPGCILGRGAQVYPVSHVRGQVPENHIFKAQDNIVPRG